MIVCLCIYACSPRVWNGPHCETKKITFSVNQGTTLWKSVLPGPVVSNGCSLRFSHTGVHEPSTYRIESSYFLKVGLGKFPGCLWWSVFKELMEITSTRRFSQCGRSSLWWTLSGCGPFSQILPLDGWGALRLHVTKGMWTLGSSSQLWLLRESQTGSEPCNTHPRSPLGRPGLLKP